MPENQHTQPSARRKNSERITVDLPDGAPLLTLAAAKALLAVILEARHAASAGNQEAA